jgi:F-type H+-transporting ATPase subunit epsilon
VFVSGGFAEVSDNTVTILAESAEPAQTIDFDRAERSRERAEKRLAAKAEENVNQTRSQASLQRAIHRLALRGKA